MIISYVFIATSFLPLLAFSYGLVAAIFNVVITFQVEEPEYSLVSGNLIKNMNMHEQGMLLLLMSPPPSYFHDPFLPILAHSSFLEFSSILTLLYVLIMHLK